VVIIIIIIIWPVKMLGADMLLVMICLRLCTSYSVAGLIAPVVTSTSIILSSNKIQNGDILALAYTVRENGH